ncbi:MAG: hypothetical protein COC19_05560 [SAR86 cluster bacterium]|uniref:Oligopeptide/dipeptide ABC transporter C-terminal domain-containing protein n=1 Tax=SAR86 cluster bacterium TaxID=2030880 RepID=A0A2A4MM33_9GAMM|nr:MAG: hypothetical protein COC19_05560 [SAR86 cluster bacterium]
MYAGKIVESGSVDAIFYRSLHPYTVGLKNAMPSNKPGQAQQLTPIAGSPPDLFAPPAGCAYCPRCPHAMRICAVSEPVLQHLNLQGTDEAEHSHGEDSHHGSCWLHDGVAIANTTLPDQLHSYGSTDA